ncbi:fatty acid desaturase [Ascidiaceihabitans sp.]|uniref:fatty acid desaturase n=1 Tax=Ascidiaceihabitans sp. TaxID=1872644 RepID=UPI00329932B7
MHTDIIAGIAPDTKASLTQKDTRKGLRHLAVYVAALGFATAYIVLQGPFWSLMMIPQGVLIVFLFTLSHECTHHTPFAQNWMNNLVGHLTALPLILPFMWFRYFHLAHHRFTNDPDRDPELAGAGRPHTWKAYVLYLSGWGYWTGNAKTLLFNAFGALDAPYLPPRQHGAMRGEARVLLGLYALIALSLTASPVALWIWVVPALIGQPVLRLYLLAEHGHCPPVADMLENTRTTYTSRLVRFLAWNMPYHAEHHSYPTVPFHQLPALHDIMQPHLKSTSPGYRRFTKDYVQGLDS